MSCPHGANSTPATCSQCLGVIPRKVAIQETPDGAILTIDGQPTGLMAAVYNRMPRTSLSAAYRGNAPQPPDERNARHDRRPAKCSQCGSTKHMRPKCPGAMYN